MSEPMTRDEYVYELLNKMMDCDLKLYEKILDTPGFAYHFSEILNLARGRSEPPLRRNPEAAT